MTRRVIAFVPDLLDRSKVAAAAPDAQFVTTVDLLSDPSADLVVVDLDRPGAPEAVAHHPGRVVGFARHTEPATIERARSSGCEAMARSVFFARTEELLSNVAGDG